MRKNNKKNIGFVILELLVVISIIGAIAVIIIPQYLIYIERVRATDCMVNRKNIEEASIMYIADHGEATSNIQDLVKGGHLKTYPVCKSGGVYVWIIEPSKGISGTIGCSVHYWSSPTPSNNQETLFSSDFDDMKGMAIIMGGGTIENGNLVLDHKKYWQNRVAFGDNNWKDYEITVNATLKKGNGYGVYYRSDGKRNITGYIFQYDPGLGNKFVVRKVINGREKSPFQIAKMPKNFPVHNQSHEVNISVKGDSFTIKVDGEVIFNFNDTTFSSGSAGFRTWSKSYVQFHSVQVLDLK